MAKTRFSISLDEEHAAQIKDTAARLGVDVSSFMDKAAMEVVRREARKLEIFAEIDARIAAAEAEPRPLASTELSDEPLPTAERTAISEFWDDFFKKPGQGAA
jgi:hypothetical protein